MAYSDRSAWVAAAAAGIGLLSAASVRAEGTPGPIEPGHLYMTIQPRYESFETPKFEYLRLFVDDRAARGDGLITVADEQGSLLDFSTDSREVVPEFALGIGIADSAFNGHFKGTVRAEATGFWLDRDVDSHRDSARPDRRSDDRLIEVVNGAGDTVERRTDLAAYYENIDGSDPDLAGVEGGFLADSRFGLRDVDFDMDEKSGGGDILFYLDYDKGKWKTSWGFGFTYLYRKQNIGLDYAFRRSEWQALVPGAVASAGGDFRSSLDFEIESHYAGAKLAVSIGRELWKGTVLYVNGSIAPVYARGDMDSRQEGICLDTCEFGAVSDVSRGVLKRHQLDESVAYFARGAMGISIQIWRLMLSGQIGANETNGYYLPVQSGSGRGTEVRSQHAWGYFGRAGATLLF